MFSYGSSTPAEIAAMDNDAGELDSMTNDDGTRGQILWIRGLTRLQHQVSMEMKLLVKVLADENYNC